MNPFEEITFQGTFRDYQQRVLDHLESHQEDNKVHIVAAPGSGKTILGLELIRHFGTPALILSPTGVIRSQWGQRWEELFLTKEQNLVEYFTETMCTPSPLTSLTYQAFYSFWNKENQKSFIDDILQTGIQTICLDEAHHLKRNWHRALKEFLEALPFTPTIISLTATPPTDSTDVEWGRYLSLAGEVDEEITIPELVADGTLCPHQDFLYFNHPNREELIQVNSHQQRVTQGLAAILSGSLVEQALEEVGAVPYQPEKEDLLFCHTQGVRRLLSLAQKKGLKVPKKTRRLMFARGHVEDFTLFRAEEALQFILSNPKIFSEELSHHLRETLLHHQLIIGENVRLQVTEATLKSLEQSVGKLKSIGDIAKAEQKDLRQGLRLVILTDYIHREFLSLLGTGADVMELGAVPVFETVRQAVDPNTPMAILTGSVVVVPTSLIPDMNKGAAIRSMTVSVHPINNSDYCQVDLGGNNHSRVALVTQLFEQGKIHIIVGTKALLGEGWDSPCVNSLIIASEIGSYVSSNQMRGRAIRKHSVCPDKVSNIWHLITVLPPSDLPYDSSDVMYSDDYAVLSRRFLAFMAPTYRGDHIENGISRVDGVHPPYDQAGIQVINGYMEAQAANRAGTAIHWKTAIGQQDKLDIIDVSNLPFTAAPPRYLFKNILHLSTITAILSALFWIVGNSVFFADDVTSYAFIGISSLVILAISLQSAKKVVKRLSPWRYLEQIAQNLLNALVELGEITSTDATLFVQRDAFDSNIQCGLAGGTLREKRVFAKAIGEMLSPIDSPRYVIFRRKRLGFHRKSDFRKSFACPTILGTHRHRVEVLEKHLQVGADPFDVAFTMNSDGRKLLLSCLKESYINRNSEQIKSKRMLKKDLNATETFASFQQQMVQSVKSFFLGIFGRLRP